MLHFFSFFVGVADPQRIGRLRHRQAVDVDFALLVILRGLSFLISGEGEEQLLHTFELILRIIAVAGHGQLTAAIDEFQQGGSESGVGAFVPVILYQLVGYWQLNFDTAS